MGRARSAVGTAGVVWPLAPLDGFTRYLRVDRGLSTLTVAAYVSDVGRFLARWEGSDLRELTAAEVSTALLGELDHRSPATVRRYGVSLRSFLRYCQLSGLIDADLSASALPVSGDGVRCCLRGSLSRRRRCCCIPATGAVRLGGAITR